MNKYIFLIFLFCPLLVNGGAQSDLKLGDKAYAQKKYGTAYEYYQKAAAAGKEQGVYNSGAALYRLEDYSGASEQYLKAAQEYGKEDSKSASKAAQDSYYNLANAQYKNNQTKDALLSLKKAILLDGKDEAAIHNMQFMIQQHRNNKQDQQNKEGSKNTSKDNKDNSKDQSEQGSKNPNNQNQDNQDKNGQGQDKQDQNDQDKDSQNQNSQGQDKEKDKLKQQAEDILKMLGDGEKKNNTPPPLQGQTGNNQNSSIQVEKDW